MILAADALSSTSAASGIFAGADLPRGLEGEYDCACATSDR
jgi:MMP endo-(1,4)-3-O-methyl-alpha-D-mannosidase